MKYALTLIFALFIATKAQAIPYTEEDLDCITKIVYNEAGNQSLTGKRAVAFVVVNRVKSKQFKPKTVCDVINQRAYGSCQFSCGQYRHKIPPHKYTEVRGAALDALEERVPDITYGATFYKTIWSRVSWRNLIHVVTIGAHAFYKGRYG